MLLLPSRINQEVTLVDLLDVSSWLWGRGSGYRPRDRLVDYSEIKDPKKQNQLALEAAKGNKPQWIVSVVYSEIKDQ